MAFSLESDHRTIDLSVLEGKTLAIIGGFRRKTDGKYPCTIVTHDANRLDPAFYGALEQADTIVILTRFVSHAAMWEAKAHAFERDKCILFTTQTNVNRIVAEASEGV